MDDAQNLASRLLEDGLEGSEETCIDCGSDQVRQLFDGSVYICMQCEAIWEVRDDGQRVNMLDDPDLEKRIYAAYDIEPFEEPPLDPTRDDILGPDDAIDWNRWRRTRLPDPEPVSLEAKRKHTVFEHDPFIIIKMPADEEFIRREGFDMEHPVSGDTRIVTHEGLVPIRDLAGKSVKLLTKRIEHKQAFWQDATVKSFGIQPLLEVTLRQGKEQTVIRATASHRWYVLEFETGKFLERTTETLVSGDPIPGVSAEQEAHDWFVGSVLPTGQSEEVFCAQVPETGVFVLENNILTGNCLLVAYKEYCQRLKTGEQIQFSLVDTRDGLPKVDFELSLVNSSYGGPVTKPVFTQIRGKRNQCPPADEYLPALMAFFEAHPEWQLGGHGVRNFDGAIDGDKVLARWRKLQSY